MERDRERQREIERDRERQRARNRKRETDTHTQTHTRNVRWVRVWGAFQSALSRSFLKCLFKGMRYSKA